MGVPKILNIGVWPGTSQLLPWSGTFRGSHDLALVQKSILVLRRKYLKNIWGTCNVLRWIIYITCFNISGEIIHLKLLALSYKPWYCFKLLQPWRHSSKESRSTRIRSGLMRRPTSVFLNFLRGWAPLRVSWAPASFFYDAVMVVSPEALCADCDTVSVSSLRVLPYSLFSLKYTFVSCVMMLVWSGEGSYVLCTQRKWDHASQLLSRLSRPQTGTGSLESILKGNKWPVVARFPEKQSAAKCFSSFNSRSMGMSDSARGESVWVLPF